MDELIRQQKNEEACRYIDKLLASRGLVYQGAVNSGNMLVDGLVNYKIPYIKSLHIDFRSEVVIPSNLEMPEDNLCIIIGNLLDNAIEGTRQLQENERHIFFKFVLKKDNFFFHDTEFLSGKCCYQERKLFPEHYEGKRSWNGNIISKACRRGM